MVFSISVFIFLILLLKKQKTLADKVFAGWIGYVAIHILLYYLHDSELIFKTPFLIGTVLPLPVLHGVFLFFYTKELVGRNTFKTRYWFLHLGPFLILFVLLIPFFLLPKEQKIEVYRNNGKGYEWFTIVQLALFLVTGIVYNVASYRLIRKYRKKVLNYISRNDHQMLRWLEVLIIGLNVIWVVMIISEGDDWVFIAVSAFVCFIGIYGFRQVPVYFIQSAHEPEKEIVDEQKPDTGKYKKSGLSEEHAKRLFDNVEKLMTTERLYEQSDLTLAEVASRMNEPVNHLSQAINSQSETTFYHYVNNYRIQAFIEKMKDPANKQFTYLALAMDCGFNSKSTFNKYFKIHTGMTPTQFSRQVTDDQ